MTQHHGNLRAPHQMISWGGIALGGVPLGSHENNKIIIIPRQNREFGHLQLNPRKDTINLYQTAGIGDSNSFDPSKTPYFFSSS